MSAVCAALSALTGVPTKPDGSGSLRSLALADRCVAADHKTVPRFAILAVPSRDGCPPHPTRSCQKGSVGCPDLFGDPRGHRDGKQEFGLRRPQGVIRRSRRWPLRCETSRRNRAGCSRVQPLPRQRRRAQPPARQANHLREVCDLRALDPFIIVVRREKELRQKSKFACVFNANTSVQISVQKDFSFVFSEIEACFIYPASCRGTYASSRYVGCGPRWT